MVYHASYVPYMKTNSLWI